MIKRLYATLFLLPFTLVATEYAPWFPRYLELQPRFTYTHEWFNSVDTSGDTDSYRARNDFYEGSIEVAYDVWDAQLEFLFDSTRSHHLGPDNGKGTVRYLLRDDVLGDPFSWTIGLSLSTVFTEALHDISVFHHGHFEGELHSSIGKEWGEGDSWSSRAWGVLGIGAGDQGGSSPWLHGSANWEINHNEQYQGRLFCEALYGLGARSLDLTAPFRGYGTIQHQSIDLGGRGEYVFECNGSSLSLEYRVRLHARNCPRHLQAIQVSYLYPFGL